MKVNIQLNETSQPLEYTNVKNTYTKGNLFCVYLYTDIVHKVPVNNIFRIVEDYGYHGEGRVEKSDKATTGTPNMDPVCTKTNAVTSECIPNKEVKIPSIDIVNVTNN